MRYISTNIMKSQLFWGVVCGVVCIILLFPIRYAFADPHAVFYTDRGQEQVFFNVLAALNQADYVEPPDGHRGAPTIEDIKRMGEQIETGQRPTPMPSPSINPRTGQRSPALEPQEQEALPRIRVRMVTADDGDVYYREFLQQRATVEQQRKDLSTLICRFTELYWGKEHAKKCTDVLGERGGGGFNILTPP